MAPTLSAISSNSTASSTRATRLYRPGDSKPRRSSSWSTRVTEPLLKQFNSLSPSSRNGNKVAVGQSHLAPPEQGAPSVNEETKTRTSRRRGRRKSVTFEDNIQESNSGDVASPAGTVRRKILPSRDSLQPAFHSQSFNNGDRGEVSESQSFVTDKTPYEYWRQLRRRLERDAESTHSPAPDERLLRPKKRTHSRTVSHEDVLTGRGANPRTGLVSPSLVSENSFAEDSREDLGHHQPSGPKWRLKGDQWISLDTREETPTPTPPVMENPPQPRDNTPRRRQPQPQPPNGHASQQSNIAVPLSELEDRFVVNMPSARDPCPPTMTAEQIEEFQKNIDRVRRGGGFTLNSDIPAGLADDARGGTPKGPQKRTFSIIRKAVGSSPSGSRWKQPDGGRKHTNNTLKPHGQDSNLPRISSAPIPRQREYYNADEVGRDLVGSTFNRQVAGDVGGRSRNVSQNPFLDVSEGQENDKKNSDGSPLFPKTNNSPLPVSTSGTKTEQTITGGQEPVLVGIHDGGQDLQKAQQTSPSAKQCRCLSHTIPSRVSPEPQWLRYDLPSLSKGAGQSARMEKENQGAVAYTSTSTSTTTSTPITTSFNQDHITDQKQAVNPSCLDGADGIACAHHMTIDHTGHPLNETEAPVQAWNKDAVSCDAAPPKTAPSQTHAVAAPTQQTRSQVPLNMPGSTRMQETPNGDGKTNAPSGERCERCQGYYHVRDKENQTPSVLKKSYTLVEQSCIRSLEKRVPARNGKLYRRNTDGQPMAPVEADRPCCGCKAVLKRAGGGQAPGSEDSTNGPPKGDSDSTNEFSFLDPVLAFLSEGYTLLQEHRAFQHAKTITDRLLSMSAHCFNVVVRVYDCCCVYSQTGSWPPFEDQELNQLMRDLGRAGVYLVILAIVATLLGKAWTYIVIVGSWFFWVLTPVRWAVAKVCGMMFSSD